MNTTLFLLVAACVLAGAAISWTMRRTRQRDRTTTDAQPSEPTSNGDRTPFEEMTESISELHYLASSPWRREDWNNIHGVEWWLDDLRRALDQGADPNARDSFGNTPLIWLFTQDEGWSWDIVMREKGATDVMTSPYAEAARLLIDRGARINAQDTDGNTALHLAAQRLSGTGDWAEPDYYATELLLRMGADVTIRNKAGMTAFESVSDRKMRALYLKHSGKKDFLLDLVRSSSGRNAPLL